MSGSMSGSSCAWWVDSEVEVHEVWKFGRFMKISGAGRLGGG